MPSMSISIEILHPNAAGEVVLDVDFTYRGGSPASFYDPGDPPEVEIETIFWPIERLRRPDEPGTERFVKDHIEMPYSGLPSAVTEAIEAQIAETFNPAEYYATEWGS